MTQKVSTSAAAVKPKSNFAFNCYYKIKSNFKIMMILLILHLISAPLVLINLMFYVTKKNTYDAAFLSAALRPTITPPPAFNGAYLVIAAIATFIAALIGILIVMENFNYLFKKSNVDMTLSLPITTDQRFFSDFVAGLFTYLAPFVVSSIITLILTAIGQFTMPGFETLFLSEFSGSFLSFVGIGCLGLFFIMLMIYTLSVLVTTCCGAPFESAFYTIAVNGLIPGTIAIVGYIMMGNLYGIDANINTMPFIEMTSPIGGVIGLSSVLGAKGDGPALLEWLIPFILVTFLFFAASFFLYKRRKAEHVSKPFVYKGFYYVIITAITYCVAVLFFNTASRSTLMPFIITTAIIYLLFEVVTNRGFKKFWKSAIRYVVTIAVVLGFNALVNATDGFGVVYKTPKAESVVSASLTYNSIFSGGSLDSYTFKDPAAIAAILSTHKSAVENYRSIRREYSHLNLAQINTMDPGDNPGRNFYVHIAYRLKNGQTINREYQLNFAQYSMLIGLDLTDEYIDRMLSIAKEKALQWHRHSGTQSLVSLEEAISEHSQTILSAENSPEQIRDFFAALSTDLKAIAKTPAEYYTPSKENLGIISNSYLDIALNANYVNTLKYLNDNGIRLPDKSSNIAHFQKVSLSIRAPHITVKGADGTPYYGDDGFTYNDLAPYSNPDASSDVETLLRVAQPNYFTTVPCYTFNYHGASFTVPPEYSDLAKKVYDSGKITDPALGVDGVSGYIIVDDGKDTTIDFFSSRERDDIIERLSGLSYEVITNEYSEQKTIVGGANSPASVIIG